ncbi:MAG: hypothetical protein ABIH41_01575, partial [Nanoarchaeota archaeon]
YDSSSRVSLLSGALPALSMDEKYSLFQGVWGSLDTGKQWRAGGYIAKELTYEKAKHAIQGNRE